MPYPDDTSTGTEGGMPGFDSKPAVPNQEQLRADADALAGKAKSEFDRVAQEAKSQAQTIAEQAKSQASGLMDQAKSQVSQLTDQAKDQLAQATDKAKEIAGQQKEVVANQFVAVADAIDKVAGDLEESNAPGANYVRIIADNAQQLSANVRDKDVSELLNMAQDFGRRQPVVFMGAAALLGFAASRFLMASAQRVQPVASYTTEDDDAVGGLGSSYTGGAPTPSYAGATSGSAYTGGSTGSSYTGGTTGTPYSSGSTTGGFGGGLPSGTTPSNGDI